MDLLMIDDIDDFAFIAVSTISLAHSPSAFVYSSGLISSLIQILLKFIQHSLVISYLFPSMAYISAANRHKFHGFS
jgi:hypothetical protein